MIPDRFAPVLAEMAPLAERFRSAGHRLYLVGGTVRDLLRGGADASDLDATTDARPAQIKALLDGWADAIWTQGERFGTIGAHKINRPIPSPSSATWLATVAPRRSPSRVTSPSPVCFLNSAIAVRTSARAVSSVVSANTPSLSPFAR